MGKTKKTKNTLLGNQKLRKRKVSFDSNRLKLPLLTLLVVSISSILILGTQLLLQELAHFDKTPMVLDTSYVKDANIRTAIAKSIYKKELNEQNLFSVAKNVQEEFSSKRVTLLTLKPSRALVMVENHEPIAVIDYGRKRLVSNEGLIFGKYIEKEHFSLPLIQGISIDKKISFSSDQSISMSKKNSVLISEALLLLREGLRYNIKYRAINYDPYRGFQVLLKDKRIRVEMGRTPFKKRYVKLVKILSNLSQKRVTNARIELDYRGKAFIKEFSL